MMIRRSWMIVLAGFALCVSAGRLTAGPLSPPAGPVAPTPGPEPRIAINATNTPGDADSVFRITTSGSYYLTEHLTAPAGRIGIEVANSEVTIDLNGYTVAGFLGLNLQGVMIEAGIQRRNVVVKNGSVVTCGLQGINLSNGMDCAVVGVHLRNHAQEGILVGDRCRLVDCAVSNCGTSTAHAGIEALDSCVVTGCVSSNNAGRGIDTGDGSTVEDCTATGNGVAGIRAGGGSSVRGCAASSNVVGINGGRAMMITGCSAFENTGSGFIVGADCHVSHCSANSNGDDGITTAGFGTSVIACTADSNTGNGIQHGGFGLIQGNTTMGNVVDGITTAGGSRVVGNSCTRNSGVGIRVSGSDSTIEGNTAASNAAGIVVTGTGNLLIRNSCASQTTNYFIVINNRYGTIVDISAGGTSLVDGSSATGNLTTTDSTANYSY